MTEIRLYAAKVLSKDNKIKLEQNVEVVDWRVFYGVEPGTEPMLNRSGFGYIQTMPIPTEAMLGGVKIEILCDVREWNGRGKDIDNPVIAQRKIEVVYDDMYIGYYLTNILKDMGALPSIPIDKLELFTSDMSNTDIEKTFGTKEFQGTWNELRRIVLKASIQKQQWNSLTVDLDDVEALIRQMGWDSKKADAVRKMAKEQPPAFAALKQKISALVDREVSV